MCTPAIKFCIVTKVFLALPSQSLLRALIQTTTAIVIVFVSGFSIFLANSTMLLLVPSINSTAVHFVLSSTHSVWLPIELKAYCTSCNILLFILLFNNKQTAVISNYRFIFISISALKTSARKFHAKNLFWAKLTSAVQSI
jgi:hypothetical protein